MKNIKACLEAAGSSMDKVVRRRIYTMSMDYLMTIQDVTARYFDEPYPVSTAVQVSRAQGTRENDEVRMSWL